MPTRPRSPRPVDGKYLVRVSRLYPAAPSGPPLQGWPLQPNRIGNSLMRMAWCLLGFSCGMYQGMRWLSLIAAPAGCPTCATRSTATRRSLRSTASYNIGDGKWSSAICQRACPVSFRVRPDIWSRPDNLASTDLVISLQPERRSNSNRF